MTPMSNFALLKRRRGFSLIELMVVLAIIGIGLTLAVPYFAGASTAARERGTISKFQQDFDWGRAAAGAFNVSGTPPGVPIVKLKLFADCHWETTVNTVLDPVHSMTTTQLAGLTPAITCVSGSTVQPTAATLPLPSTFTFTPQGFVDVTGTLTFNGSNGVSWPLQFLLSGSVIRAQGTS